MDNDMMVRERLSIGDFDYADTKHILLCGDVGYIKYCGLTMTSIFMSNPKHHFEVHLVCDDVNEADYIKLKETSSRFAFNINIYKLNYSVVQSLIDSVNKNFHISVACFFRILGFSILGKYIENVLYFDSDIMVIGDIGYFFGGDNSTQAHAIVVRDVLENSHKKRINVEYYFNSGAMFVDLKKWNDNNFTSVCIENIKKHHYEYMDQDALNVALQGKCTFLPKEYDFICDLGEEIDKVTKPSMADIIPNDVRIIHFCGRSKPWCSWVQDFRIVKKYMEMLKASS